MKGQIVLFAGSSIAGPSMARLMYLDEHLSELRSTLNHSNISAQPAPSIDPSTERQRADEVAELKAQARRLAAHCNKYKGADTRRAVIQIITTTVPLDRKSVV